MKRAGFAGLVLVATIALAASPAGAKARTPGPLRIILVGDSITVSYQDEAAAALRAKGYEVTSAGIAKTGLLDASFCRGQFARAMLNLEPDVVIYENIGNYAASPPCKLVTYPSESFYKQWAASARRSQRILTRKGARFFWVLNPASANPGYAPIIPRINAIYAGLRASTLDAWSAFGGTQYNASLHDSDGVHLNQAGQDRMAALITQAVG
jgi:lysophospholipase L1-like esterase